MLRDGWAGARDVVRQALHITRHDRNEVAGDPEDNFAAIALTWTALLHEKLKPGAVVTAADHARMMAALKLCRDAHAPRRDNRVDLHGYGLCLERVDPTDE